MLFLTQQCIYIFTGDTFFLGVKGKYDCSAGEKGFITDGTQCRTACKKLGLPLKQILGRYACYKDRKGNCYQDGHNGAGASLVCKRTS